MKDIKCGFCHLGTDVESICGKLYYNNKNTAAHQACMKYSAKLMRWRGKYEHFGGFDPDEVESEIQRGRCLKCSICKGDKRRKGKWGGATAGCALQKCRKGFHYYCAKLDDLALAKRYETKQRNGKETIVMYRVFCCKAHCEQFIKSKEYVNQHHSLINFSPDAKAENEMEELQNEGPSSSLNTQMEDLSYKDQLSPARSLSNGESSTNIKGEGDNMSPNKNKTKGAGESAKQGPKQRLLFGTEKISTSPARVSSAKAKQYIQEEDDDDSSEVSSENNDFQSLSDTSDSELLYNPFIKKPENTDGNKVDGQEMSRNQICELESDEDENSILKDVEKSNNHKKQNVCKETNESFRKAKQDAKSHKNSYVSSNGSKINSAAKPMTKCNDQGTNKTSNGYQGYITAEVHVPASPSSDDIVIIEDDDTNNGQGYSFDNEMTKETDSSRKGFKLQKQLSRIDSIHLNRMSPECKETEHFPDCALAVSSTTEISSSKRDKIIRRAKERFDVNHVAMWTPTDSFSDQLTDNYLPHFMGNITNMVRERMFEKLVNLLTDMNSQDDHRQSIKHMVDLPDEVVEKFNRSLLEKLDREEINGKEVLFFDTKLNTLFLKLNDAVDRVCKIRNILLPHAKESLGHLFKWKGSTISSAPLSQSDAEMEWKGINDWMTHQKWNQSQYCIYPSDDILLAEKKNQGIEELIKHQSPREENKRKVIFVKAMKELVNSNMFIHELILSSAKTEDTLIVSHLDPIITLQSLVPVDLQKDTEVQVMSAFKPSNKRGISIIVIHVWNQKQQKENSGQSQISTIPCEGEITVCLGDINPKPDRKRRAVLDKSRTSPQKRKRAA